MNFVEKLHRSGIQQRRANVLAKHMATRLPPDSSVLDIGSGDGHTAKIIQTLRPDVKIIGTDVLVRDDAQIEVIPFDGKTLPFESESMQSALFIDVLHHVDDAEAMLKEAKRVCSESILIKDHFNESRIDEETLKFMDNVGNRQFGVSLPYKYLSRKQWDALFLSLGVRSGKWDSRLGLYPIPLNFLFERNLHFVCTLHLT